mgnify:CR=1
MPGGVLPEADAVPGAAGGVRPSVCGLSGFPSSLVRLRSWFARPLVLDDLLALWTGLDPGTTDSQKQTVLYNKV